MRTIDGKVSYNDITPSGVVEHGREVFSVTVFDSGQRVIRTLCEFDAAKVVRDVVYTVDAALQPVEAYIRILDGDSAG